MIDDTPRLETVPSADLARTLFMEAGDALFLVDPDTERLFDVNPMARRLTQLERDELVGQTVADVLRHERDAEDWIGTMRRTTVFHGRDGFLLRTRTPDVWVPVSVSISRLHPPGAAPLALFMLRDQREQVEAYQRLRQTEAELRRVLVSVPDCLWSCETDDAGRWRYRYLSPVVERITDRPVGYFLEDPARWREVVHAEDLLLYDEFVSAMACGRDAEIEYRLRRANGAVVWVRESVAMAPREGRTGHLAHGIVSDITAHKQAEQAIRERKLVEEQRFTSLSVLAGGLAHDFNNLLTGILGNANLALLELPPESPARGNLRQIEAVAWRAADLCQQMLAFAGKGRFLTKPLDLNAVLQESTALLRASVSKRVPLTLDLAPELPRVLADATQLRQIALNLVLNASEAIGEGDGSVRVATGEVRAGSDELRDEALNDDLTAGDYVCLDVSDDGPGMTAEVKSRMFEPFYTTKFPGRGMGLAAVLGIVRAHRGAVHVRTTPGAGTTVRVLLPAECAESPDPPTTTSKEFILIVDDEEFVREVAVRMAEASGLQALLARDGREALEQYQLHAGQIRFVLLDFKMPLADGAATLRGLRRLVPGLPVVVMSGYPADEVLPLFPDAENVLFLQKPFGQYELLEVLRKAQTLVPAS